MGLVKILTQRIGTSLLRILDGETIPDVGVESDSPQKAIGEMETAKGSQNKVDDRITEDEKVALEDKTQNLSVDGELDFADVIGTTKPDDNADVTGDNPPQAHNAASHSDITSSGESIEDAVTKKHTTGFDTALGAMAANINMNTHKLTGLSVPSANGDSIRATAGITEVKLEGIEIGAEVTSEAKVLAVLDAKYFSSQVDGIVPNGIYDACLEAKERTGCEIGDAIDKKHTQNTDTALGAQAENLDMNTHKIVGVVDPTADQDAATKKFVLDNSINNVVEDITPQLSGDLDGNAHNINLTDGKYLKTDKVRAINGDGLLLQDDGGNGIFIKDGGNVGIGTTSPDYELHVESADNNKILSKSTGADSTSDISVQNDAEQWQMRVNGDISNSFSIRDAGGEHRLVILPNTGNVGIGTITPDAKLQVVGTVKIGDDNTNYASFAADGELTLVGTARIERHLWVGAEVVKPQGATPGTAGIIPYLSFANNQDNGAYYSIHVPHRRANGTGVKVAILWYYTGGDDANACEWNLTYIAVAEGEDPTGAGTALTEIPTIINSELTIGKTEFTIPGGALTNNDTIGLYLWRDGSDDLGKAARAIGAHITFTMDKLGLST